MELKTFDLNLLVVFEAVLRERSVTRAGEKLGLSQPAMSHALNRLRWMLKDQLFVRTPEGMMPTPRAEFLAEPICRALFDLQRTLEPEDFVAEEADRRSRSRSTIMPRSCWPVRSSPVPGRGAEGAPAIATERHAGCARPARSRRAGRGVGGPACTGQPLLLPDADGGRICRRRAARPPDGAAAARAGKLRGAAAPRHLIERRRSRLRRHRTCRVRIDPVGHGRSALSVGRLHPDPSRTWSRSWGGRSRKPSAVPMRSN